MKILNVKVRGAIGFKKGLGVDEIEVDLRNVEGLIALSGQNGRGKTTLLESLSPFRTFASRNGGMKNHFFLRDSYRDLAFSYAGDEYRSLVKIDSDSDRGEGFIWKNGEPQVNGKLTQYDEYITNLLGSSTLFYSSVFCAQNAKKLSDMPPGKIKELFVEFLRLDRLARYQETAKQAANVLIATRTQTERQIEYITQKISAFSLIQKQIQETRDLISVREDQKTRDADAFTELEQELKGLESDLVKNQIYQSQVTELNLELSLEKEAERKLREESCQKWNTHQEKLTSLKSQLQKTQSLLSNRPVILEAVEKHKAVQGKIESLQRNGEEIVEITAGLQARITVIFGEIQQHETERIIIERDPEVIEIEEKISVANYALRSTQGDIDATKERVKKYRNENALALSQIDGEISACKQAMAPLKDRPAECNIDTCSFIRAAMDAEKKLSLLQSQRELSGYDAQRIEKEFMDDIDMLDGIHDIQLRSLQSIAQRYNNRLTMISEHNNEIAASLSEKFQARENVQASLKKLSEKQSENNLRLSELIREKNSLQSQVDQLPALQEAERQEQVFLAAITEAQNAALQAKKENDTAMLDAMYSIQNLEARIKGIQGNINAHAPFRISVVQDGIQVLRQDMENAEKELAMIRERLAVLLQQLSEKKAAERALAAAQVERQKINSEISEWEYLKLACGKNGLQALEIDGVAPLITSYANDLLATSFGPVFTVRLITQDDAGKETLDILVVREDGSETSLSNLSGGQKVWILKALRLAMTLVSKEKSGRNFQTFFGDEEDGALDGENAINFIGLYRSLMSTGNFDSCYYISHNPDVVAMADHQIVFTDSGIEVM